MRIVNVLKLLIELTDSKTPKAKKAKKEARDCTVKKEVGKFCFFLLIAIINSGSNNSTPFLSFLGSKESLREHIKGNQTGTRDKISRLWQQNTHESSCIKEKKEKYIHAPK